MSTDPSLFSSKCAQSLVRSDTKGGNNPISLMNPADFFINNPDPDDGDTMEEVDELEEEEEEEAEDGLDDKDGCGLLFFDGLDDVVVVFGSNDKGMAGTIVVGLKTGDR